MPRGKPSKRMKGRASRGGRAKSSRSRTARTREEMLGEQGPVES